MRILFLTSRFPYPLDKGDKLRAFYQIAELSKKHHVILASVSDAEVLPEHVDALKPFCKRILLHSLSKQNRIGNLTRAFFNGKPFQAEYFYSEPFKQKIDKIITDEKPDVIFCQLVRMVEYVREVPKSFKGIKILDYQDAFSKGYERQVQRESFFKRIPVRMEWKRMLRYERDVFDLFEKKIIISEQDRDLIEHKNRNEIAVIPNGVDTVFYAPMQAVKKYDLIFSGNMNYPPNIESALYIARQVLPILLKKRPELKLVIAGTNPSKEILALESKNIHVTGWVDDIREPYSQSRIHLAPMLISIGLQNKILQAMAMKIPCIVSSLANKAIHAPSDDCLLIADTPAEYADKINLLLEDEKLYKKLAENGYRFIHSNFNWSTIMKRLEQSMFF